jgi:hypothetical protein
LSLLVFSIKGLFLTTSGGIMRIFSIRHSYIAGLVFLGASSVAGQSLADTWTQIIGTAPSDTGYGGGDYAADIVLDSSGNLYITGGYDSVIKGGFDGGNHVYDAIVSKLDAYGNTVWMDVIDSDTAVTTGQDHGIAIDLDSNGNVYVFGKTNGDVSGEGIDTWSYFLAKYNSNGVRQWIHQFGESSLLYDLAVSSDGYSYIVGGELPPQAIDSNHDMAIFIFDSNGTQIVHKRLLPTNVSDDGNDVATSVTTTSTGDVYVAGWAGGSPLGNSYYDTKVVKLTGGGSIVWSVLSGIGGWDKGRDVTYSESSRQVIVVGEKTTSPTVTPFIVSFDENDGSQGDLLTFGPSEVTFNSVAIDQQGSIYITGGYGRNSVPGDSGNWGSDILFAKYSDLGEQLELESTGVYGERDSGLGIAIDGSGSYFIAGSVAGDLHGVTSNNATSTSPDIIVMKNAPPAPSGSVDTDGDGVADDQDNCTLVANSDQFDADSDGFGNMCDGDLDNDGDVDAYDLRDWSFDYAFFPTTGLTAENARSDLNNDGTIDAADLDIIMGLIGSPPGPSGVAP